MSKAITILSGEMTGYQGSILFRGTLRLPKNMGITKFERLLKNNQTTHQISKVIHNTSTRRYEVTTVVFFSDETKILVRKGLGEIDDPEKAVLWAYFIKNSGKTRTQAKKEMKRLLECVK